MFNDLTYFFIALISCSIGSILGIGGGVIIVPLLLSFGIDKVAASANSAVTVLSMTIISSYIYWRRKQGDIKIAATIALGSIPASYLGAFLNKQISDNLFHILFTLLIILLLAIMFFKTRIKIDTKKLSDNMIIRMLFGFSIGIFSGLFGIGGGPITLPILMVFFNLEQKAASGTSIYVTLLTAVASASAYLFTSNTQFSLAVYMIPGAILGANIGTSLNKKLKSKTISILLYALLVCILIENIVSKK